MKDDPRIDAVKDLIRAGKIKTASDVTKLIKEMFPEGLKEHYDKDALGGGAYIGFNLCRYGYTDRLAAELHALRDLIAGDVGYSYGFEFKPHVKVHEATDERPEHYEVYTG